MLDVSTPSRKLVLTVMLTISARPPPIQEPPPTAIAGPAPPRPPNPELLALRARLHAKLSSSLHALSSATDAQRSQLAILESDLLKGEPAIVDEMQRLEAVRAVCDTVRARYEAVVSEAEGRLGEYERRGDGPEVDEIVCSSTVVYNQLVELVAEDAALEDTIYQLGRGLNSETADIDLDRFLKVSSCWAFQAFTRMTLTGLMWCCSACGTWQGSSSSSGR